MTTDNNPNIILTLVAQSHRAHNVWADPHNESFYLPPVSQAIDGDPPEVDVSPDDCFRQVTPSTDDPGLLKTTEPKLQITFSRLPKNPGVGYLLGSDRELCDIFLGPIEDRISHGMYAISFNQNNEVVMKSSSGNPTVVTYDRQTEERRNFTWIFPSDQKKIFVNAGGTIKFDVEVPTHDTDTAAYEANCQMFKELAESASHRINILSLSSQPNTNQASGAATPRAKTEPPFYLQGEELSTGGFDTVYKGRAIPHGGTVAVKCFKSKDACILEAGILRTLSKTPHHNIVQFVDYGLGDTPYLAMGLAPEGNLQEQHIIKPFTIKEIGLLLRQMLGALVYLHVDCGMTHRNITPTNILCDSRAHFRLADFASATEGDVFTTFAGTLPYMAPEVLEKEPYTAAVDMWGLGMVIATLSTGSWPPGYEGTEGARWCTAVVAHFTKWAKFCLVPEQIRLNALVQRHMLRVRPQDRESAVDCLDRGDYLWWMLGQDSKEGSKKSTQEDPTSAFPNTPRVNNADGPSIYKNRGPTEKSGAPEEKAALEEEIGASGEYECSGDIESDAESEISEARTMDTDDWMDLERRHPFDEGKEAGKRGRISGSQHFIHGSSVDRSENVPEDSTTPGFNGHSETNTAPEIAGTNAREVLKPVQKRKNLSSSKPNTESIDRVYGQQTNSVPMKRRGSPSGMSRRQKAIRGGTRG